MSTGDRPAEPLAKEEVQEAPKDIPQLGALEEDDEFEEFPVQDWDDSETNLSHLTGGSNNSTGNPGGNSSGGAATGDSLWEDNWDDDDIEDDFSKQLREELAKAGNAAVDTPMSG